VPNLIDLKAILIVALIFVPLELLIPLRAEQKILRRHWFNDLLYLFLNGILINFGMLVVLGVALTAVRFGVPAAVSGAIQSQPMWLQVIEVLVVADLGFYLAHRAFHAFPFLWKFHSVHHSIEEMDWLAAHRVHPLDQVLTKTASLLPVFALGFSDSSILIFALIYKWQALVIHSNSKISLGPLNRVFASPQFHHWHHANTPEAFDKNFAGQLVLIDTICGTLFMPDRMPSRYGTDHPVPDRYHQQLVYPLRGLLPSEAPTVSLAGKEPQ
jgi:sterol desaturase/sphingolipid hydroxylase (fatty acid hydroxylase superfamily)